MKIDFGDAFSDVLTSVLNSLQFKGEVFCYARFTSPWAIKIDHKDFAHFHYVENGEAWIELEKTGARTKLLSGDFVIMPHGDA